ncbi:hypothetical protein KQX54_005727 [Cotesia glomerata]|uniref:Uncharacterized protein n=1 Tax=Cotesia glomerata TaxID=32391 RepID=A0AAV7IWI1_COTGL|nr:hypothetical protein KQX54_005727 [Cotesia glomerata]
MCGKYKGIEELKEAKIWRMGKVDEKLKMKKNKNKDIRRKDRKNWNCFASWALIYRTAGPLNWLRIIVCPSTWNPLYRSIYREL